MIPKQEHTNNKNEYFYEEWKKYIDEAVVEEEAEDGGTHAGFFGKSLPHCVADNGLKVRARFGVEVGRELSI